MKQIKITKIPTFIVDSSFGIGASTESEIFDEIYAEVHVNVRLVLESVEIQMDSHLRDINETSKI